MDWERQFLKCTEDLLTALDREAALREELATSNKVGTAMGETLGRVTTERDDLHKRLTAAEQRNAELLERAKELTIWMHAEWGNTEINPDCIRDLAVLSPKPTESGASHTAIRIDQ